MFTTTRLDFLWQSAGVPLSAGDYSYNLITATEIGVSLTPRSGGNPGSQANGPIDIHHNIIYGIPTTGNSVGAINDNMQVSWDAQQLLVRHNTIDGCEHGLQVYASSDLQLSGNIITGVNNDTFRTSSNGSPSTGPRLTAADYNIYEGSSFKLQIGKFTADTDQYNSLATWQAAQSSSNTHLSLSNPDANSTTSDRTTLFTDADNNDWTNKAGSPAIGFMSDGSNAGAYQYDTETIGIRVSSIA
jgi:hypothetical protein